MDEKERQKIKEEKIGIAIASFTWYLFVIKFILVASAIAVLPVYLLGKPLWWALVIGFIAYFLYITFWRMVWRLFWKFLDWGRHL